MKRSNKNIDQLFQIEKKSSTEISRTDIKNFIQLLPSTSPPNNHLNTNTILNLKNIIMISIPSILVIGALILAPKSPEISSVTNNINVHESHQELSTKKNIQIANIESREIKPIISEKNSIQTSKKNKSLNSNIIPIPTPSQNISSQNSKPAEINSQPSSNPTTKATSKSIASIGSQIAKPQSINNLAPINSLQARRLKKLLYKNLLKDGLIKSKNISVEIELLSNSIIVNGKELNQKLHKKYKELTQEVGTGKDKKIKMNPQYIKIGEFTEDGFRGIGVGKFTEEFINQNKKPIIEIDENGLFALSEADKELKKQNEAIKAESNALRLFVEELYKDQDRNYKISIFSGNHINTKELNTLHQELHQLLLADKYIETDEDFIAFELGENELLFNLKKIEDEMIQPYLKLISSYKLKRKDNRMIKMSKNTLAYGDFQPGSFTGTFLELQK